MPQLVYLTDKPVRVTAAQKQDLRLALDVLDFDELDLMLHVQRLDGTSPSLSLSLETSMQNESEDGWLTAVTYTSVTSANTAEVKNITQFLRYLRWTATLGGSGSPAVTFTIQGMGRRWA
jgi:hypothetical protein